MFVQKKNDSYQYDLNKLMIMVCWLFDDYLLIIWWLFDYGFPLCAEIVHAIETPTSTDLFVFLKINGWESGAGVHLKKMGKKLRFDCKHDAQMVAEENF